MFPDTPAPLRSSFPDACLRSEDRFRTRAPDRDNVSGNGLAAVLTP